MNSMNLKLCLNDQVELQFHGSVDITEKDAIFNYRRKYLPTQQVQVYRSTTSCLILVNTCIHNAQMHLHIFEGFMPMIISYVTVCIEVILSVLLCPHLSCTTQVAYHTPPRFPIDVIETIREGASLLFQRLGLRDFARIDGWFLPNSVHMSSSSESKFGGTELGNIIFTDINLVSQVSDFLAGFVISIDSC